ncbi:dynamin family protein [Ectobacillus ponti]|uniref:Dynamin family protein n=1 Tax=Ectobacillus ponti TaxID=2961894 RepID=A0AA41X505_9BACI|nr:dynamin family protein [Ectobacillus ponti]MCP8968812.1 dynamin family protein [Ectobacillus ponti]
MKYVLERSQLQPLLGLYETWKLEGDAVYSTKLLEVARKQAKGEFLLAFCGHFSAGKSTMMNHLYGSDLLPTSPIPTSANVVKIQRGADRVVLTLQSGVQYEYAGAYSDQELKQLCKNGDEVVGVHIYRSDANLPDGVILIDTPGIDSTDEAHKLATESALHLADVIFYMMDYNHVQSEVNLQFVKELKERQKRVYLVINQIDKHKENELTFAAYQESVSGSFANWNVVPDGIFYTSLRSKQHPHNELGKLEELLHAIVENRASLMKESLEKETDYLLQEHLDWRQRSLEQETEAAAQLVSRAPDQEAVQAKLAGLYEARNTLHERGKQVKLEYGKGVEHILENAYLMPAQLRELAQLYLETELTNFRFGLFFAKAKTEKEKESRLQAFYSQLRQTVESQLDFHIKEYILSFLKQEKVYTEELGRLVYDLSVEFEPALLRQVVKPGAGFTGDYVLNYTNDLAQELKRKHRNASVAFLEAHWPLLQGVWERELADVAAQLEEYERYASAWHAITQGRQEYEAYTAYVKHIRSGEEEVAVPQAEELLQGEDIQLHARPVLLSEQTEEITVDEQPQSVQDSSAEERVAAITGHVRKAEEIIRSIPALQHLYEEIAEKRERLETRQFTVALFGAFSAGKSSFANALLGEKVLPVSPNPTTATINKIMPVTTERPHGTVLIQLKSADALLKDLQQVYRLFEKDAASLEEALQRVGELLDHPSPSGRQKTTFSFLRAVQRGYSFFAPKLGQLLTTDLEEFAAYVAEEEKSCFVEYMELYYDCEFTRKGITLVDTPGADSVNARHTDVAFQYIKNADAILFVTYYNHVFSRADREFLIQLGRVKDTFAMDKMFFIINAADLAASMEELQTVKTYIAGQLLQYGIRHPRMFPLSSLFALQERKGETAAPGQYGILAESGMHAFMEAFTAFTMKDLLRVSIVSLQHVLQGTQQLLSTMLQNAEAGNEEKEASKKRYTREREQVLQEIRSYSVLTEERALLQEVRDLLYYVRQRIFLRYRDIFPEIFNPAALRADKGDIKQQVRDCTAELLDFMKHDLLQEMRATSLRIEKWMKEKLHVSREDLAVQCQERNRGIMFDEREAILASPAHGEPMAGLELGSFKKAMALFKNTKSFFEQNERAKMQEEMKQLIEPFIAAYTAEEETRLLAHYQQLWQTLWQGEKQQMEADVEQYYEGILYALSETIDVSLYKAARDTVQYTVEAVQSEL